MVTFDNGCIMYGFCSLKEPTSALPRYILINWVSRRSVAAERRLLFRERMGVLMLWADASF